MIPAGNDTFARKTWSVSSHDSGVRNSVGPLSACSIAISTRPVEGVSALNDCCGVQRLPNGNTIVCDYGAGGKGGPKMIEVTREKKVVWSFKDFKSFGNSLATAHVLDIKDVRR